MSDVVIKIIAGVVGTAGFAVLFRLKPSHWVLASLDGLLACLAYFMFTDIFNTVFLPNGFAALLAAFFAEVFAKIGKTPSTVFLLPGIICLVPGSSLYYSMSNLLSENYVEAAQYLLLTAEVAVALGGGIIGASILKIVVFKVYESIKLKIKKNN